LLDLAKSLHRRMGIDDLEQCLPGFVRIASA
jgi:hypothetical protein